MNKDENLQLHKKLKHRQYNHTLAVYMSKKRYIKETKRYKNKSNRRKIKQNINKEL